MKNKLGFTLIEMLVVVLIIGILAGVALPQYQMAVTKAKVASILPLMRRWKDAMAEYKLQHGEYCPNEECPNGDDLGVNWPSDWENGYDDNTPCGNSNYCKQGRNECVANEEGNGEVDCYFETFMISFHQGDDKWYEDLRDMIICKTIDYELGNKICKALGGKFLKEEHYRLY